jgi:phosphonate transport system substrate-binding protein
VKIVSLLAANFAPTYQAITEYLQNTTGIDLAFYNDVDWQLREKLLDAGEVHGAFMCGLLYARKSAFLEPLAAPIMRGARYHDKPIYFSDVIVRADSRFHTFDDLRGATFAFNDPDSFSGLIIMREFLARKSYSKFFGRIVESGGHLRSMQLVVDGEADTAAIDSTILEAEMRARPELKHQLRVVESLGPNPIPPIVIVKSATSQVKSVLRAALTEMDQNEIGRAILSKGMISRFIAMKDGDYDQTREVAQRAEPIQL